MIFARITFAMGVAALLGCGTIDMSPQGSAPSSFAGLRRIFVSDSAANDSLPGALVREGLKFTLQPNEAYDLRVATTFTDDKLGLYLYQDGRFKARDAVVPTVQNGEEVFRLQSDQLQAEFYVARLLVNDGAAAAARLGHTHILPANVGEGSALNVHLFLVGKFAKLPDAGAEAVFAQGLLDTLTAIYSAYGIVLQTSYDLVNPTSPPVALPFGPTFYPLPGLRIPQTAHLYLVDSIYVSGAIAVSGMILGFAPREAMDLATDPESRVVLNSRAGSPSLLATTAAHELGHFFGLRHPTATAVDLKVDDDESNRDDGFASTTLCIGLTKASAAAHPAPLGGPGGRPYCLYVAAPSCPAACDLDNLMFPYDCSNGVNPQRALTIEQQVFVRTHLGLLQGL